MGLQVGAALLQFVATAGAVAPAAAAALLPGDPANGKFVYTGAGTVCHGANGKDGTHGAAPLSTALTHDALITVLTNGRSQMPACGSSMPVRDRNDVAAYALQMVK